MTARLLLVVKYNRRKYKLGKSVFKKRWMNWEILAYLNCKDAKIRKICSEENNKGGQHFIGLKDIRQDHSPISAGATNS